MSGRKKKPASKKAASARGKKSARVFKKKSKRLPKRKPVKAYNKLSKRRGREVYDIFLKPGAKTQPEIKEKFNSVKLPVAWIRDDDLPETRIKFTFVARHQNKISSITYNYDVDGGNEIKDVMNEILHLIFTKPVRGTGESIKRMNRLKNYIERVIIDFESAE